ncbi:unnamed protein product [Caenorhabditis bovis]|uniref:Uncharacterized protein n=1 Tax=Caenorhabditis bovis TaxID=2654633 RepID=A0A8S1F536_9PELO|nr:unnamed protein product [Caenorhabditis bovis]
MWSDDELLKFAANVESISNSHFVISWRNVTELKFTKLTIIEDSKIRISNNPELIRLSFHKNIQSFNTSLQFYGNQKMKRNETVVLKSLCTAICEYSEGRKVMTKNYIRPPEELDYRRILRENDAGLVFFTIGVVFIFAAVGIGNYIRFARTSYG